MSSILSYIYGTRKVIAEGYVVGSGESLAIVKYMLAPIRMRSGINIIMIHGPLGVGKSYYAIKAAYYTLRKAGYIRLGYSDGLKYVIDNYMVFTWEEFKEKITRVSWKNKLPVLIWDDAGVYGHAYEFFTNKIRSEEMSRLFQVIRTRCYNVVLTAPSRRLLLASIREMPDTLLIIMHHISMWESEARAYRGYMLPDGKIVPKLEFIDRFNKKVPDDLHEYYMSIRDRYNDIIINNRQLDEREQRVVEVLCSDPGRYFKTEEVSSKTNIPVSTLVHIVYPSLKNMYIIETKKKKGIRLTSTGLRYCS